MTHSYTKTDTLKYDSSVRVNSSIIHNQQGEKYSIMNTTTPKKGFLKVSMITERT